MRTCPTCAARYEAPAQYCQVDGASLRVETEPTDPYIGTRILDQFRLTRVVGSGGMGVVYEGLDEGLGRRVAVKILHRDLITNKDVVSRFHREAQIAHQLDHPGIVRVILFGQLADGNLYLVLEFLEGPTLEEAITRDRVFTPARTVKVLGAVSDAIGYAHARGIVHRDLKPENIILTPREGDPDFPKVLDFGIAKMLIGAGTFVTQTGLIFGTARYISPEGAAGEPVDQRGDVYSLGVIAYQLLTGHTPFEAEEPVQLLIKHMHEPPPWMKSHPGGERVPPAIEAVVMRALAKNPAARQPDGNAFGRALRDALKSPGPAPDLPSIVATSSMPFFAEDARPAAVPAPVSSEVSGVSPMPVAAAPGSGVQQVRRVVRPATGTTGTVSAVRPVGASQGSTNGAAHPPRNPAPYLPPTLATEALPPVILSGSLPPLPPAEAVPAPLHPPVHLPSRVEIPAMGSPSGDYPGDSLARSHGSDLALDDELDDIHVPGLPRLRRGKKTGAERARPEAITVAGLPSPHADHGGGGARTVGIILTSAILALCVAGGTAWALRLFPAQRRVDEVGALVGRASDALSAGRFVHATNNADVEDLTDAVLALDPANARAMQLRRAAASRLKADADAERSAGRPERAVQFLQDALRLVDDHGLQDELTALQHEIDAQRAAGHGPVPANGRTPRVPVHHPSGPRGPADGDPTLVHPPQQATPVVPPTLVHPPQQATPVVPPTLVHPPQQATPVIPSGPRQPPRQQPAQQPGDPGGFQTDFPPPLFGPSVTPQAPQAPPQPPPPLPPRGVFTPAPGLGDPNDGTRGF